jgi:hypothetical protein
MLEVTFVSLLYLFKDNVTITREICNITPKITIELVIDHY